MNHYFTINYSILLHEKSIVLYKRNNFINILKISVPLIQHCWQLSIQKYITKSLTTVIKTKLLAIICKT